MLTRQRNKFHEHNSAKHKHILSSWISESFLSTSFSWNKIPKQFCLSLNPLQLITSFLSSSESPEKGSLWRSQLSEVDEHGRLMGAPRMLPARWVRRKETQLCSKLLEEPELTCLPACVSTKFLQAHRTKPIRVSASYRLCIIIIFLDGRSP